MKVIDVDMQNKNSVRQSNIELLRIIAMVMIVGHHFAVHGWEGGFPYPSISVNRLWIQFIQMGGKIGVNVFYHRQLAVKGSAASAVPAPLTGR